MDEKTLELIQMNDAGQLAEQALELITAIATQKRELDRAEKAIKGKLMGVMGAHKVDSIKTDAVTISLCKGNAGKTVENFDLAGFRRDFPELESVVLLYTSVEEKPPTAPSIKIQVKKSKEEI